MHSKVTILSSGLAGEVVGLYQEFEHNNDPIKYMVKYQDFQGLKQEEWLRDFELHLI